MKNLQQLSCKQLGDDAEMAADQFAYIHELQTAAVNYFINY